MNTQEFKEKLLELQPHLRRFANKLIPNKERAEDLLQETNLKTLENQEKFTHDVNFKAWVFTIMARIFINECKKWVRNIFVSDFGRIMENQFSESGSADTFRYWYPVEYFDLRDAADKCVSRMSPENQEIWKMYVEGFRYDEIAEKTGLVLGTVKSRIYGIRQELRKNCEE